MIFLLFTLLTPIFCSKKFNLLYSLLLQYGEYYHRTLGFCRRFCANIYWLFSLELPEGPQHAQNILSRKLNCVFGHAPHFLSAVHI